VCFVAGYVASCRIVTKYVVVKIFICYDFFRYRTSAMLGMTAESVLFVEYELLDVIFIRHSRQFERRLAV